MKLAGRWVVLWLCLGFFVLASPAQALAPNPYEAKILKEKIRESFQVLMDMWKEELYFDMYDIGQRASKFKLTKGEFAQRMVDLKWKPSLVPTQILQLNLPYHSYAQILVHLQFESKTNPNRIIVKEILFPVILEEKNWRFDLTQMIRIPFIGRFPAPAAPAPAASATKKDASTDATGDSSGDSSADTSTDATSDATADPSADQTTNQ